MGFLHPPIENRSPLESDVYFSIDKSLPSRPSEVHPNIKDIKHKRHSGNLSDAEFLADVFWTYTTFCIILGQKTF